MTVPSVPSCCLPRAGDPAAAMVPLPRSSLADQMQAELAAVRPGPVLPEVHGLPGAEQ